MIPISLLRAAGLVPAFVVAFLACGAVPTRAEETMEMLARFPIPQGALAESDGGASPSEPLGTNQSDASAMVFDPSLVAAGRAAAGSGAHLRARSAIPIDIIRNGFASRDNLATPDQERSVGFKLGQDRLSFSTTLTSPAQPGGSRNASLGWRWAQPISAGSGIVWGVSTGGSSAIGASPEQTGDAVIGYRQQLLPHLTLTSQLGLNGNYVFAAGDGLHSALMPEVKLSVDLAKAADLPWQASVDLGLARKLPLVASDYQTSGTAMFSLKYSLQ